MKEDYLKVLKKVTSFFPSHLVPFNRQNYQKQNVTKQIQKNSFISYVLSDQVWWCNIKQFLSYSKITSANLYKPIHDIKYSNSIYTFESGKCGKKGKKIQKF